MPSLRFQLKQRHGVGPLFLSEVDQRQCVEHIGKEIGALPNSCGGVLGCGIQVILERCGHDGNDGPCTSLFQLDELLKQTPQEFIHIVTQTARRIGVIRVRHHGIVFY